MRWMPQSTHQEGQWQGPASWVSWKICAYKQPQWTWDMGKTPQVCRSDQTLPVSVCPGCLLEKKDGGGPFLSHVMDPSTISVTQCAGRTTSLLWHFDRYLLRSEAFLFTVSQCLKDQSHKVGIIESACVKVLSALQNVKICAWRTKELSL